MGNPTTPQDAAPAYDDLFQDHPVNQSAPSGSASAYAAVPQIESEDVELQQHRHTPNPERPIPTITESFRQTVARTLGTAPHHHCETCDVQTEARERRADQLECCKWVAGTFMVAFFCAVLLGWVVAAAIAKKH